MRFPTKTILVAAAAVFSACEKDPEIPADYQGDFIFYFNASVSDGTTLAYKAGQNGYGLTTDYVLEGSTLVLSGTLAPDADPLHNAVIIRLRSERMLADVADFDLESDISEGAIAFRDASGYKNIPGLYDLSFYPVPLQTGASYQWTFGDGSTDTDPTPVKRVFREGSDSFEAQLQTGGLLCSSSVTHFVNINTACDATIDLFMQSDLRLGGELNRVSGTVAGVKWFRNGAEVVSEEPVLSDLSFSADGAYTITAQITFEDGCTKRVEKEVKVIAGLIDICDTDFTYTKQNVEEYDAGQLGTVELIYYDANGERYSSYYEDNNGNFALRAFKEFRENEKGQSTIRFLFDGSVTLKSEYGDTLVMSEVFGNFAVAHP